MKQVLQLMLFSLFMSFIACSPKTSGEATATSQDKTETIKVSGACGMCKKRIEMAVYGIAGIKSAQWSAQNQALTVSYNPQKTNNEGIQKKVVSIGHDTEKFKAEEKAYKNLPSCCQYREVAAH